MAKRTLAPVSLLVALLAACDEQTASSADAAAPPASATAAIAPQASSPGAGAAKSVGSAAPTPQPALQLLRLTLTSDVKNKEPVGILEAAEPGQRVWAHLAVRNRSGKSRRLSANFRVDGEERSTVDLTVEPSWSYRTWAYNTLRAADKSGELTLEVRDDEGAVFARGRLPIRAPAAKKGSGRARPAK